MTRERIKSEAARLLQGHEYNKRYIPVDIRDVLEAAMRLAEDVKNETRGD